MKLQPEKAPRIIETPETLLKEIRSLKRQISHMKGVMEHVDEQCMNHPDYYSIILYLRKKLEQTKVRLTELGGTYTPTRQEQKNENVNAALPYIAKAVFTIGRELDGFEVRTIAIDGDTLRQEAEHTLGKAPTYRYLPDDEDQVTKEDIIESFEGMYLGEWKRKYEPAVNSCEICDGTEWRLEIYFSNGQKPLKFRGMDTYPCNFKTLLDIFNISPWPGCENEQIEPAEHNEPVPITIRSLRYENLVYLEAAHVDLRIAYRHGRYQVSCKNGYYPNESVSEPMLLSDADTDTLAKYLNELGLENWQARYEEQMIFDGEEWKIIVRFSDRSKRIITGSNCYPEQWPAFQDALKWIQSLEQEKA